MKRAGAVLAVAGAVLLACASDAEQPAAPEASESVQMITVSGRVVTTGSDPHVTLVVITDTSEHYELVGERAEPLWDLQQRRVTVRGRVVQQALGPGFPAHLEVDSYTLAASET